MKLIIFGAGKTGEIAFSHIGYTRISYFVDNGKHGGMLHGKNICSFSELMSEEEDFILIIASEYNYKEMEKQVVDGKINKYFIFHEKMVSDQWKMLPIYSIYNKRNIMSYAEILVNNDVCKFQRIAIYGYNILLPLLITELALQNDLKNIVGVIDPSGQYEQILNVPKISIEDIDDQVDCVIVNEKRCKDKGIRSMLEWKEKIRVIDIFDVDRFIAALHHPELQRYKNIHKGKRAFIIGNGPSLRVSDLDVLHNHNEICFGVNKIFRIYNETKWRPTYLCVTDSFVIDDIGSQIDNESVISFLADSYNEMGSPKLMDKQYIHLKHEEYYPNYPGFSDDITKQVFWGYTVTYDFPMQLAAYMGISEIYLIGMDHFITGKITDSRNHGIKDYYSQEEIKKYENRIAELHKVTKAYEKADEYSRRHGFRIFNATRGGKLDVFERVDFDSLFV